MPHTLETEHPRNVTPSIVLQSKLGALRRRLVQVQAGTGLAVVLSAAVVLFAASMLLDWWLDLSWTWRAIVLGLQTAVIGFLLWRGVLHPIWKQPDDDTLALLVEKGQPEFHTRLIAATQLTRPGAVPPGAAPSLVETLLAETEAVARHVPFRDLVETRSLKKAAGIATVILACGVFLFVAGGQVSVDLLGRAFLGSQPVPRKTRIVALTGDTRIGRGDALRIEGWATGVLPNTGHLIVRTPGRRNLQYALERDKEQSARYGRTIENVQQSFTYTLALNDGVSKTHRVEVVPRPTVVNINCVQTYPAYTRLPVAQRALGDLSLLAGSQLRLMGTASKDLQGAMLQLVGLNQVVPVQIDPAQPKAFHATVAIPSNGLTGFSVQLMDQQGMESRDAAVYRVEVVPDKPPSVRLTYPDRKEELVTRLATMVVAFDAVDDFQIAKARLRYRVSEAEEAEIRTIELDLGTNHIQRLRSRYEWKIPDITPSLAEGSRFEFWVEMEDNNNVTGPGMGSSDHQMARVVSENEKRADLLNRAGDYLGTIVDLTGDQERVNRVLGELIREKSSRAP